MIMMKKKHNYLLFTMIPTRKMMITISNAIMVMISAKKASNPNVKSFFVSSSKTERSIFYVIAKMGLF